MYSLAFNLNYGFGRIVGMPNVFGTYEPPETRYIYRVFQEK